MMGIPESQYALRLRPHQHHPRRRRSRVRARPGRASCRRVAQAGAGARAARAGAGASAAREHPTDDLTSALVARRGRRRDAHRQQELGSFFVLLVAAGNETTRNAISHGMKALCDYPEQRARWMADFEALAPTAVEEIVRWATPVIHFRRTATRDTELGGQKIRAGEKVVLWYNSAQSRRGGVRGSVPLRRRPHAQRARRLRRPGPALLPRRAPGAPRDHGDVPRALPPPARSARSPASPPALLARSSSTASSTCRASSRRAVDERFDSGV